MLRRFHKHLLTLIFYGVGFTPLPILHALGFLLGTLIFLVPLRIRYYVSANIRLCFPQLSFWAHQHLVWRALREMVKGWLESPVFWVRSKKSLLKLVRHQEAIQPMIAAVEQQRGALVLGAHLGGFYLKNAILAHYLPNTTYLYKPQKGILGEIMNDLRNQFGGNLVATSKEGVLALFRHLKNGGAVGMICDHNVLDQGAMFAPFFNIRVPTMTLPGKLAAKTHAPVFMAIMERLSWGRGYHFHVWPVNERIYSTDIEVSTTQVNAEVAEAIKRFPAQHEWLYRRFWDRPAGEKPLYKTQK